jgi:6-phosphogluconolactonase (cycloisomerase 2 family)
MPIRANNYLLPKRMHNPEPSYYQNHKFIFVTCYSSDFVDVYKINADNFEKVASLPCPGHPVGVDVYEDDNKLEAWVCSYSNGAINVYTFKKK